MLIGGPQNTNGSHTDIAKLILIEIKTKEIDMQKTRLEEERNGNVSVDWPTLCLGKKES